WYKNGTPLSGETDSSLDLSTEGNGDKNDVITVRVTVSDGTATDHLTSAGLTVGNSAPSAGTVSISPSSPGTNATLTATPSGFSDADGDALTYHYTWKNGTTVVGTDSSTLDLSVSGAGDKGETVHVSVTASDGTASSGAAADSVTVANSAPSAGTVPISPSSPGTNATLTATPSGFSDADGDSLRSEERRVGSHSVPGTDS